MSTCYSPSVALDYEAMAAALAATGQYRVLRRLVPRLIFETDEASPTRRGLFVDVETTGLTHNLNQIFELAKVRFTYGVAGWTFRIESSFEKFRQPTQPIPAAVTMLPGTDNDLVAGKPPDPSERDGFAETADLVLAHE